MPVVDLAELDTAEGQAANLSKISSRSLHLITAALELQRCGACAAAHRRRAIATHWISALLGDGGVVIHAAV
jgi:hypothetical protein